MDDAGHTNNDSRPDLEHGFGGRYLYLFHELLLAGRAIAAHTPRDTGMLTAEFEVIRELAAAGGRSHVSEMSRQLQVDPAAVSRLVSGLERRGLVVREADPHDGRRRPVLLSDEGRRFAAGFQAYLHDLQAALMATVDPDSLETTLRVLRETRDALDIVARRQTAPPAITA